MSTQTENFLTRRIVYVVPLTVKMEIHFVICQITSVTTCPYVTTRMVLWTITRHVSVAMSTVRPPRDFSAKRQTTGAPSSPPVPILMVLALIPCHVHVEAQHVTQTHQVSFVLPLKIDVNS